MWGERGFCLKGSAREESLSLERLVGFISEAASARPRTVTISGGEPLLSPLCIPLAEALALRGLRVMLTTNATLLPRMDRQALALFDQINVSIDGPPLVLERLGRGGEKTFGAAVDGMRRVLQWRRKGRPALQLITVITPESAGSLLRMLDRFAAEGVTFDSFLFQHEMFLGKSAAKAQDRVLRGILGKGVGIWDAFVAKAGALDAAALGDELVRVMEICPDAVVSPALDAAEMVKYYRSGSWVPDRYREICFSPWFDLGIAPNGDVWLCPGFAAGNINGESFEEIWNGPRARALRKRVAGSGIFPGCRACFYLYNY